MLKKSLSYWFVILIAMQSITAIANTIQVHQPSEQYLSFDYERNQTQPDATQPQSLEKSSQFFNDGLDCHPFCSCHLYLSYLPESSFNSLLSLRTLVLNRYNSTAPSGFQSSIFRPPKI